MIELKAIPAPGYAFLEWNGDLNDDSESTSIELSCNKAVTAVFSSNRYVLATSSDPIGCGEVMVDTPPPTSEGYLVGTEVIIEAIASKGYKFSHWSGDTTGTKNPIIIVMGSDKQLSAHFIPHTPFPWWWLVAGIGAIIIVLLVYLLSIRKLKVAGE